MGASATEGGRQALIGDTTPDQRAAAAQPSEVSQAALVSGRHWTSGIAPLRSAAKMGRLPMRYGAAALWIMTALIAAPCSYADELAENMPCSRLITVMNSHTQIRLHQSAAMIMKIMGKLDSAHIEHGETGIMDKLNNQGESAISELTSVHCREHPNMTIFNAAAYVYDGLRGLLIQIGTSK